MKRRGRKARCVWCGSGRTIGKGVRRTVSLGDRRLRLCRACGRKFTVGRRPDRRDMPILAEPVEPAHDDPKPGPAPEGDEGERTHEGDEVLDRFF